MHLNSLDELVLVGLFAGTIAVLTGVGGSGKMLYSLPAVIVAMRMT